MVHQVLYRKYRPKTFEEVVGQERVVRAVTNAIKMGKVAHAYLFSGPRGVGKTTIARLIAKSLNCEGTTKPCNICAFCVEFNSGSSFNLIEIDAASNRGIDEVRELRENVRVTPAHGRYKIYVVDEAHQLTKEAFNALLKTLEEPPAHAVFILATTELEKIPQTIISRTQQFDFRRPTLDEITARLIRLALSEKLSLEHDAALLIAFAGEGSMRDAESILGKISAIAEKTIDQTMVEEVLGVPPRSALRDMFQSIVKKDSAGALAMVEELHSSGHDINFIFRFLMMYFRNALLLKSDNALMAFVQAELLPQEIEFIQKALPELSIQDLQKKTAVLLNASRQMSFSPVPQLPLELAIVELCQ